MLLRALNIVLLGTWTAFLGWLLTYGRADLTRLLHPRLWWVLGVAVVVLLVFVVSLVLPGGQTEKKRSLALELPGALILLTPLIYFLIAKDARLDGTALHNRIIQNDSGIFLNNLPAFELFDDASSPAMAFSRILRDPEKYAGEDVELICQSFVSEELPQNTAMCYRYMITCCAADALPAFIFLQHPQELTIENDRWIKVNGQLSIISNNNMVFPSVEVSGFEYVEEPAFPWAM